MELYDYITIFRRRIWISVVVCVLAGGIAFVLSSSRPHWYETHVTISVGKYLQAADPNTDDIRSAQELAQTYAALVTTRPVLENTLTETGLDMTPEKFRERVKTEIQPGTSLLQITVTDKDPALAAALANELANQLILNSPSALTPEQQTRLEEANLAIKDLDQQLQDARDWLADIDKVLSEGADPYSPDLQWLITQRNVIIDHINRLTESQTQYFTIATQLEEHESNLTIVEYASVPTETTNIAPLVLTGFSALGGLAIASIGVVLLDYFDHTIRSSQQITETLGFPLLARIPKIRKKRTRNSNQLKAIATIGDPVFEQYRMLRTNLQLSNNKPNTTRSKKTFIISSPGIGDGKSTTSVNLAAALAVDETRVLLIDADLRQPSLHKLLELAQSPGLTTMISNDTPESSDDLPPGEQMQDFDRYIQDSQIQGFQVITSGDLVGHPSEILGSDKLISWLSMIQSTSDADIILIDTPPALVAPDALILATKLDASVILVLRAGKSNIQAALEIKRQFEHFNLDVEGVVLNAVSLQDLEIDYGSYYRTG